MASQPKNQLFIVALCATIVLCSFLLITNLKKQPAPPATTPQDAIPTPTATSTPTTSNQPKIPSSWLTYDKTYNGLGHYTFRYPPDFSIDDGDPDSSSLSVYRKNNRNEYLAMDSLLPWGFDVYVSGSRREWFLKNLNKENRIDYTQPTPKPYNYSQLRFTEVNFDHGTNYLLVTNWPKDSFFSEKGSFYFAIQNGVEFNIVSTLKDKRTENLILSSLSARKPAR